MSMDVYLSRLPVDLRGSLKEEEKEALSLRFASSATLASEVCWTADGAMAVEEEEKR